ncbi:hypothetical protein JMJ35_008989 [Cladonia borealis]|uniref:Zn(2)-C6 fungal-type domain-containing protein n=1 Tax=Cladonia borealis TaxID=184061 RepID=A0AA39QT79_9LECA|nr:hypothetical protein JMJ35_008989 [Cladonia borealis]
MAPPRRKSCLNCVKGKRRCDAAVPDCQRCASKGLACDYLGTSQSAPAGGPMSHLGPEEGDLHSTTPGFLIDDNFETLDSTDLNPGTGLLPFPEQDLDWSELQNMGDMEGYVNAMPATVESGDDCVITGAIYHSRVVFVSQQFKTYPGMFYKRGQTPFIHRHMYDEHTPTVIYDALSSCALYCGKNKDNETLVFGDISRKVRQLKSEMQRSFLSPVDHLASVQALLLYQIIRLLDGDVRQRADAESDEAVLMSWNEQLQSRMQPPSLSTELESSPNLQGTMTTSSWQDWIVSESVRRTVLTCYMLQGVYSFLKLGYDKLSGKVDQLAFTAQSTLWNAPSEFHWREALKSRNPLEVTMGQWDDVMDSAQATDFEEFGVMIMAAYKGMDIVSERLGKEHLPRYGLEWGSSEAKD